jgi:hypothetical protein
MGKTHLARAAAIEARRQGGAAPVGRGLSGAFGGASRSSSAGARAGVVYTTAEQFTSEFVSAMRNGRSEEFQKRYRAPIGLLIVEDVQFFDGRMKTQLELFHTVQHVLDAGGRVLLDRRPLAAGALGSLGAHADPALPGLRRRARAPRRDRAAPHPPGQGGGGRGPPPAGLPRPARRVDRRERARHRERPDPGRDDRFAPRPDDRSRAHARRRRAQDRNSAAPARTNAASRRARSCGSSPPSSASDPRPSPRARAAATCCSRASSRCTSPIATRTRPSPRSVAAWAAIIPRCATRSRAWSASCSRMRRCATRSRRSRSASTRRSRASARRRRSPERES